MEKKILNIEQLYATDNKHENHIKYFRISPWMNVYDIRLKIITSLKDKDGLAILVKNKEKNKFGGDYEVFSFHRSGPLFAYTCSSSYNDFFDVFNNIDKYCFIYIIEYSDDSFIKISEGI